MLSIKTKQNKKIDAHNHGHNNTRKLDALPNFLSQQVKRSVVISTRHCTYQLLYKLPNDVIIRLLEN